MKLAVFVFLSAAFASSTQAKETSRPMSEMHGDCQSYKTNLSRELGFWQQTALAVTAAGSLPLAEKLSLALIKQSEVKFVDGPAKTFPINGQSFGGIFQFKSPQSGRLRISAGSKVWFDLIDAKTNKRVEASEFEMQTGCEKIFKVVTFEVGEPANYHLQVSSSAEPSAKFLLTFE